MSLNERGEKSQETMILGKFVNKPKSKSHWPIVFGKYHVHMTYSFFELLIFFRLNLVDIYCLIFISQHIKEILRVDAKSKGNLYEQ